jgi:hypothetical protein
MEKSYGNHVYGNPRATAARAPCIDFLAAKYTVDMYYLANEIAAVIYKVARSMGGSEGWHDRLECSYIM